MKAKGRRKKRKFLLVLVAVGLASQTAPAGDRKSSGAVQESARAIFVAPEVNVVAPPGSRRSGSSVGLFETGYPAGHRARNEREAERERERKPLTLFRFNSQFGEVAVRPVIGKVNGAQFSLGF